MVISALLVLKYSKTRDHIHAHTLFFHTYNYLGFNWLIYNTLLFVFICTITRCVVYFMQYVICYACVWVVCGMYMYVCVGGVYVCGVYFTML
jgi:hypothetical protein